MTDSILYHDGNRRLQDQFDSRRISDRRAIFPNCPRYIPAMQLTESSIYAPRSGCEPPEPAWKSFADFKDHVHPRQPTAKE
jgi:hypothetical protein